MVVVLSNRLWVVDVWWEFKELFDDQVLEIFFYFVEDFLEDKLDMEICEFGNIIFVDNFWIELEVRVNVVCDFQIFLIEVIMDVLSLLKVLIDVIYCDVEVRIF